MGLVYFPAQHCPPSYILFWRPWSLHQFSEPGHQSCFVPPCARKINHWSLFKKVQYKKETIFKNKIKTMMKKVTQSVLIKSFIRGGTKEIWCCFCWKWNEYFYLLETNFIAPPLSAVWVTIPVPHQLLWISCLSPSARSPHSSPGYYHHHFLYLINIEKPESKDQVQYPKESNPKRKRGVWTLDCL